MDAHTRLICVSDGSANGRARCLCDLLFFFVGHLIHKSFTCCLASRSTSTRMNKAINIPSTVTYLSIFVCWAKCQRIGGGASGTRWPALRCASVAVYDSFDRTVIGTTSLVLHKYHNTRRVRIFHFLIVKSNTIEQDVCVDTASYSTGRILSTVSRAVSASFRATLY